VPLLAAEIHILAASAGALAHRAMMHMTHVVAVVMQPDTLGVATSENWCVQQEAVLPGQ
jgi:hypothetical protein